MFNNFLEMLLLFIIFFCCTSTIIFGQNNAQDAHVEVDSVTVVSQTEDIRQVDTAAAMSAALTNLGQRNFPCARMARNSQTNCFEFWRVKPSPCPFCERIFCSKPIYEKVRVCLSFANWEVEGRCLGCDHGRGHGHGGGRHGGHDGQGWNEGGRGQWDDSPF